MSTVLVTGGTGFLGRHCILQLLRDGYEVRTMVRDLGREQRASSTLEANGVATDAPLSCTSPRPFQQRSRTTRTM